MKHAAKQRRYLQTLNKLLLDHDGRCAGCNDVVPVHGSHRIARSLCIGGLEELYWAEENIDLCCDECNAKMNTPDMTELLIYDEIVEYYRVISQSCHAGQLYVKPLYIKTLQYGTIQR